MASRRARDFYETPHFMTRALLAHVPELGGVVLECCTGGGSIPAVLRGEGGLAVVTNDVHRARPADLHHDAARSRFWLDVGPIRSGGLESAVRLAGSRSV